MIPAAARTMLAIMRGVTEKGGTAKQAAIEGYAVGGKTGTAQKVANGHYDPKKWVSSFVGVVPAEDPRLVIIVMHRRAAGRAPGRRGRGADLQGDRRAVAALPARAADLADAAEATDTKAPTQGGGKGVAAPAKALADEDEGGGEAPRHATCRCDDDSLGDDPALRKMGRGRRRRGRPGRARQRSA